MAEEPNERSVISMPAAAIEMREKRMRRFTVLGILPVEGFRQDTDGVTERGSMGGSPDGVLYGEKHRSGREHDGGVVEEPGMIKRREVVDELSEKWVPFCREHEVIGNADWDCFGENDGVCEEGV